MKGCILIIEDSIDIREATGKILELEGYDVIFAENGRKGVEQAQFQKPDLILCDIMMPELDGYGVLYTLNQNPDIATTPFIFITAKNERIDMRRAMEMGADDYLTKPFDEDELLNAIESRLTKKEKQQEFYSKCLDNLNTLISKTEELTEIRNLFSERKIRAVKKKQLLYYEGDNAPALYLVISGRLKTIKITKYGRELVTGIYNPDDFLGMQALLLNEPYSETAEAIEDSTICIIPKDIIDYLLSKNTGLANMFIRILSNNVREKEEQLLQLAYNSVRKRMADVLLRVLKQLGNEDNSTIKISREDLAAIAGMASETVSRIITDFKNEGLITKKGSTIKIINSEELKKIKS
ncbi:hypothetical protein GCM10023149_00120 [Mucilaginibacter gynuensis]|uniref:CRP-like cAMP-binding protein n=1 Tax=Mucilaginibacter gynuensis TaxID=1302236 RepID=A0ABP8FM26_9SPHI